MTIVDGADATGFNFRTLAGIPANFAKAGYATGSGGIAWTAIQFAKYPGAIVIDQDPSAVDTTADVLDFETAAATVGHLAPWVKAATANFKANKRPGQRVPAIYCSLSNVTTVANALIAGGVAACPLWVAHYGIGRTAAVTVLNGSNGPFPIIGMQYSDQGGGGTYDLDVFLSSWLSNVSGKKAAVVNASMPPGQWDNPEVWTWVTASVTGQGLDGKQHEFDYDGTTGLWVRKS